MKSGVDSGIVPAVRLLRILAAAFAVAFTMGLTYGKAAGVPWRPEPVSPGAGLASGTSPGSGPNGGSAPTASGSASDSSTTAAPPTTWEVVPATTTSTTLRGDRVPTPADPLRVVLAGDSVMAGLAPAARAALQSAGAADVRYVLTPTILREEHARADWEAQLEAFDPDLVVMFIGGWEAREAEIGSGQSIVFGAPGWRPDYEAAVVDPWVRMISSKGAEVVWIGSPEMPNAVMEDAFARLDGVYQDVPNRFPQVSFFEAADAIGGAGDRTTAVITTETGARVRSRQLDGLHLCSDGAARLAAQLAAQVEKGWALPLKPGWDAPDAPWRVDSKIYPVSSCPTI